MLFLKASDGTLVNASQIQQIVPGSSFLSRNKMQWEAHIIMYTERCDATVDYCGTTKEETDGMVAFGMRKLEEAIEENYGRGYAVFSFPSPEDFCKKNCVK